MYCSTCSIDESNKIKLIKCKNCKYIWCKQCQNNILTNIISVTCNNCFYIQNHILDRNKIYMSVWSKSNK